MRTVTAPPVPRCLVTMNEPSGDTSITGYPILGKSRIERQSVKLPPVLCAPHSTMCPATMPAASLSQSSGAHSKRVDHRRERDPRIGAAPGHDDLRAALQRLDDRPRAVVRVRRRHAVADRGELSTVVHVVEGDAVGVQLAEPLHQVVARDGGDVERRAVELRHLEQRAAAAERVHPARIRDHARAALHDQRQRLLDLGDEVARVARARIARALLLHDRHRDLGEEVERDVVDGPQLELAFELREIVAPITACVGDANHVAHGAAD